MAIEVHPLVTLCTVMGPSHANIFLSHLVVFIKPSNAQKWQQKERPYLRCWQKETVSVDGLCKQFCLDGAYLYSSWTSYKIGLTFISYLQLKEQGATHNTIIMRFILFLLDRK